MNQPIQFLERANGLLADADVAGQIGALDIRLLGGRPIGIVDNHFVDLLNKIGGAGTVQVNGQPYDVRRENLLGARYHIGGDGTLSYAPVESRQFKLELPNSLSAVHLGVEQAVRIHPDSQYGYLPFGCTGHIPNISLDSIDNASTVLTLSHWPANRTPEQYKANLSTQSSFRYLCEESSKPDAAIVTSDHFDLDGVASIFAFLAPETALIHKNVLVEVAKLGDFSRGTSRQALSVGFALNALAENAKSNIAGNPHSALLQVYQAVLPMVSKVLGKIDDFSELYLDNLSHFERTERLLDHPDTRLVEHHEVDLAVFHLPSSAESTLLNQYRPYLGLSNISFHNRTKCGVLALVRGSQLEIRQRYESWVERVSGIPRARRDLAIFTNALQQGEGKGVVWNYDGVQHIMPALKNQGIGNSRYSIDTILTELVQFLKVAPKAWVGTPPGL